MARRLRPRDLFGRPGYVRVPNPARQEADGRKYRKGWEVRLVAQDEDEARSIAMLAEALGHKPGRTFSKHRQFVVPIYGQEAVDAFLRERDSVTATAVRARPRAARSVRAEIHDLVD